MAETYTMVEFEGKRELLGNYWGTIGELLITIKVFSQKRTKK